MSQERLIGGGVLIIGILLFVILIPSGIDSPSDIEHITLSPDFWPRIISVIFTIMGLLILVFPGKPNADTEPDPIASISWLARGPRLVVVLAVLFAFYFLIDRLGMVLPGMVIIFSMMWFAGERRWILMAVTSVAVPLLLYVFFVHVANIPIPLGIFESLRG